MSKKRFISICIAINLSSYIVAFFMITILRPDVIDLAFAGRNQVINYTEFEYNRNFIVNGKTLLNTDIIKYNKVCILPREINPVDHGMKIFGSNVKFFNNYGGLMGWNDNNWHVLLMNKIDNAVYIISMNSSLFPYTGEIACSNQFTASLDRSKNGVKVVITGDR